MIEGFRLFLTLYPISTFLLWRSPVSEDLEMSHFKSFAEAKNPISERHHGHRGPERSGKSNVVIPSSGSWVNKAPKRSGARRWKTSSSTARNCTKPLGLVEVSLVIGGLGELRLDAISGLPSELSEYQELMITRRLYRNGDSEYLINKTPCRLEGHSQCVDQKPGPGPRGIRSSSKDGSNRFCRASPQDRQELIEETTGIVRYKKQKAEALRKLESTQQKSSASARDIVAEVKKQLNSLERPGSPGSDLSGVTAGSQGAGDRTAVP